MKVFVAGGTGSIGRILIPLLAENGHDVVALARNAQKARGVEALGATAVVANVLDRDALTAAITATAPEVIVHQLTALKGAGNFKKFDEEAALTNRFRTEVTDTLLTAAGRVGTRRFIAQSFCGWPYAREGGPIKTEDDRLDPGPPASFRKTLAAIQYLEAAIRRAENMHAVALRYGFFYGPGTGLASDGPIVRLVRERKLPLVGSGAGIWSFIHIEDAARATVAAITLGAPGLYNVVDDEPAPVSEWLPYLANAVGAKPPWHVPEWLATLATGEGGVAMMTRNRRASNARAKRDLRLSLVFPTWRRGFVDGLA